MKLLKIFLISMFYSLFFISFSYAQQSNISNLEKRELNCDADIKVNLEIFNDIINYDFLKLEDKKLTLQIDRALVDWKDKGQDVRLEKLLSFWKLVDYRLLILQAGSFIGNEPLSYRVLQRIKLTMLHNACNLLENDNYKELFNKKNMNKVIKSLIDKNLYLKYSGLFKNDEYFTDLSFFNDLYTLIKACQKDSLGSTYKIFQDKKRFDELNQLIDDFLKLKEENTTKLKNLKKSNPFKSFFSRNELSFVDNNVFVIELLIKYLVKIKINYFYDKKVEEFFKLINLNSDNSYKKLLIIKHYILLKKDSFNKLLDEPNISKVFSSYLDLISYFLDETNLVNNNLLNDTTFIFKFFQVYSEIKDLENGYKGPIPYWLNEHWSLFFSSNKELFSIVKEIQEILNIILQKIQENMGAGPNWFKKLLNGKFPVSDEVVSFALRVLEERVL